MRLLIHDTFATATYTVPISSSWVTPPGDITVELATRLTAESIDPRDIALVPPSALLRLHSTHDVAAGVAVIAAGVSAIAMRTPVRPDEIERTPVRLLDPTGGAELLARATLQPFYGITPTSWSHDG
nr:hypothetical protein [Chloroflexia bacterium]